MQLYGSDGHRIATVQYMTRQGNPQIIFEGRLITVQASTLSQVNGKLTTSLSRHDLLRSH
jgi:hypothetical protein